MDMSTMVSDMDDDMDPVDEATLQVVYWASVVAMIAAFTLVNLYSQFLAWHRRRVGGNTPAKPKTLPAVIIASTTAIFREISNSSIGRFSIRGHAVFAPTLGKVTLVLAYIAVLITLCFYGLHPRDWLDFENIGYRTGRITACQLPLLFLLAGKRNIIGTLSGYSYERINWLHRWAARAMLLTTTLHMAYFMMDWARYDYIAKQVATDTMTQSGLACWAIFVWIVISSMTPIRGWRYEIFVIQHIISFAGLVGAIYVHITPTDTEYVWFTVGVFFFDRFLRAGYYLYNNLCKIRDETGKLRGIWGSHADFYVLPGGYTRVTIDKAPISSWKAGQHVLLSCQALVPLQSHPFTICSIPSDGKMEFIVQSRMGGTKRLYRHAERLLPEAGNDPYARKTVAIEGPYGHVRPLQQFDSIVLYAGGTGATFTMPLLRSVIHSWKIQERVATRNIRLVWVIKSGKQLDWFREQLNQALADVDEMRAQNGNVQIKVTIYVTCDETFTSQHKSKYSPVDCSAPAVEYVGEKQAIATAYEVEEKPVSDATHANVNDCCCRGNVDEEDAEAVAPVCACSCCGTGSRSSSVAEKRPSRFLHPELHVYSGRPMIKDIMRASLEQALGESAVIACGPSGLTHDVRMATVSLSDERAVHKGTGAQGIWLHTEGFSY